MRREQNRKPPLKERGQRTARAEALSDEQLDAVAGGKSVLIQNACAPTLGDLLGAERMGGLSGINKSSGPSGGM